MSGVIWQYQEETQSAPLLTQAFLEKTCPCCPKKLKLERVDAESVNNGPRYSATRVVSICPACGWWIISDDQFDSSCGTSARTLRTTLATGAALFIMDPLLTQERLNILCEEIEHHLKGHGKSDQWKSLEDATAAILRNFGLNVLQTGKCGDGGIDIVLSSSKFPLGVVQVKHSRNRIGASVMRDLVGASAIKGSKHAILVASSQFTSGAYTVQEAAKQKGINIELIDGEGVLSALRLTTRTNIPTLQDILAVAPPKVKIIFEELQL